VIRIIQWGGARVRMICCRICSVGVGITRYPDGPFVHSETRSHSVIVTLPSGRHLHLDDVCRDCAELLPRRPDLLEALERRINTGQEPALAPTGRDGSPLDEEAVP
jgi:hypothetical protein